ncbi:DNA-sulfur modification-associated [Nonomuraea maritima]|uniref:DNA-sulfur modification-associated n=1 Tax=Nonomuraea maritima TaxID=683260 RepID=A0A1G8URT4_9ACTN|nr:DNA sulfur modification protein DndB [Nonomuraea maritima]SDJ56449.1 DNA-sulfur modification-associated [Nonomuraea maritima]
MTIPMSEGVPIRLMQFRDHAGIGVMSMGTLVSVVPDPAREETPGALRHDRQLRQHAEVRAAVQRLLKGTAKGRNVEPYADYIAAGLRGDHGRAWSTPPLCLWSVRPLTLDTNGTAYLPLGSPVIAIDAETQVAAIHRLWNDPSEFDLDEEELRKVAMPFEIYWDITISEARQIFHDRNLLGVPVAKTLALSMDERDFGTTVARHVLDNTQLLIDGIDAPFSKYVNQRKRQLSQNDTEWITLSALRSLTVTTLLGKPGIESTSGTITTDDLPEGVDPKEAVRGVSETVSAIIREFTDEFSRRSALTTPAVLAGVGAAAHRTMPWTKEHPRLSVDQLLEMLRQVKWDRAPQYWEGVAAKRTPTGALSFAGGAKDSGHRVCDAVLNSDSDLGKRIRGRS